MSRPSWRWGAALVLLAFALVLPLLLGPYGNFIVASILVYALVSLSLTILIGFAGQISIGHAGFWAIGAYTSALLVSKLGVPFLVAVLVAGLVAGAFGSLVALPALRVQGHYLAIATLAFALLVQQVLFEWEGLTGGRQGLFVPRPSIAGYELGDDQQYVYVLIAFAVLLAWMTDNLRRSHTGQALMALRMSTVAAEAAGINRARHIITAFTLSAFFTGISGALYAHLIGFLSTDSFTLTVSLSFLTMAVIGGLGSYVGALLGAAYLTLAPELFREAKNAQMVLYGLTLILCMRFLPGGLASLPERLIAWRGRRQ